MPRPGLWLAAVAILALAALWRVESLDRRPLWLDEISTGRSVAESPSFGALWAQGADDEFLHPPLAYLGNWLADPSGESATRLRLPSVVAGLVSVELAMSLGARLFGARAGLLAGFLLAISMHHVDHSQEARPYLPSLVLVLGLYVALFGWLATRRPWRLALAVGCAVLALYTFHLALLHVAVAGAVALLDALEAAREAKRRGEPAGAAALRRLRPFALAGIALLVLYLPQVGNLRGFLAGSGAQPNHVLDLSPAVLHAIADRWVSGPAWATWICEAAFVAGLLRLAKRRDVTAAGVALWMAAPFLLFGLVPFSKYFDLRFLIAALPAFFVLVAGGLDAAARGAGRAIAAAAARPARADAMAWASAALLAALLFAPAAQLYARVRDADRRCGDFVRDRALFYANDRLCADHLLLSTIHVDHQWVLHKPGEWIALPTERLDGLTGRYRFPDDTPIVIERRGEQLVAQIANRFPFALVAESDTVFFSRIDARRIEFERGAGALWIETAAGRARAPRDDAAR
jgi:hypothetical protein